MSFIDSSVWAPYFLHGSTFLLIVAAHSPFPPHFLFRLMFVFSPSQTCWYLLKHSGHHAKLHSLLLISDSLQQFILANLGIIYSGWIISCFLGTLPSSLLSVIFWNSAINFSILSPFVVTSQAMCHVTFQIISLCWHHLTCWHNALWSCFLAVVNQLMLNSNSSWLVSFRGGEQCGNLCCAALCLSLLLKESSIAAVTFSYLHVHPLF